MLILRKIFLQAALIIFSLIAIAVQGQTAPLIAGVSGTLSAGAQVSITGSGFGTKSPAKPLVWADFATNQNPNSTLGQLSSWYGVGAVHWVSGSQCAYGGGCLTSNATPDNATAINVWDNTGVNVSVGYPFGTPGNQMYIYKKHRQNFLLRNMNFGGGNWKMFRAWCDDVNDPTGVAHNGLPEVTINESQTTAILETGDGSGDITRDNISIGCCINAGPCGTGAACGQGNAMIVNTTNWYVEEILMLGSHQGTPDGRLSLVYDGVVQFDIPFVTSTASYPGVPYQTYAWHDNASNLPNWGTPWNLSNQSWADDIYVDTTWSRVMICAGSTWAHRGHCEPQIPSAWAPGSITVTVHQGTMSGTGYLYVVDSTNTANSAGRQITFGSSGSGSTNPPPAAPGASVQIVQ